MESESRVEKTQYNYLLFFVTQAGLEYKQEIIDEKKYREIFIKGENFIVDKISFKKGDIEAIIAIKEIINISNSIAISSNSNHITKTSDKKNKIINLPVIIFFIKKDNFNRNEENNEIINSNSISVITGLLANQNTPLYNLINNIKNYLNPLSFNKEKQKNILINKLAKDKMLKGINEKELFLIIKVIGESSNRIMEEIFDFIKLFLKTNLKLSRDDKQFFLLEVKKKIEEARSNKSLIFHNFNKKTKIIEKILEKVENKEEIGNKETVVILNNLLLCSRAFCFFEQFKKKNINFNIDIEICLKIIKLSYSREEINNLFNYFIMIDKLAEEQWIESEGVKMMVKYLQNYSDIEPNSNTINDQLKIKLTTDNEEDIELIETEDNLNEEIVEERSINEELLNYRKQNIDIEQLFRNIFRLILIIANLDRTVFKTIN